ncbi:MAG TPA: hypothetical protein VE666_03020 [Mycobacterium sp.]|nr:hypothetical protein [Mycobacterium sp.]
MRHAAYSLFIAIVALAIGACTSTVAGTAMKGEGGRLAPTVDVNKLDVGRYPTTPSAPLGGAGDPMRGVLIEAQRMANNVVGPWEVEPSLTGSFALGAIVLKSADALGLIGPQQLATIVGKHPFVNGFSSSRVADGKLILLNAVLRFADAASAAAAAAELGDAAQHSSSPPGQRAPIPGHPEAVAASFAVTESATGKQWAAVRAFTPHGPYVFMQLAQSVDGLDPAAALIAKTIDLQGPRIDQFRATDPAEFADISVDPTGLLARTLPVPETQATVVQNTTYEQRGALHFQSDPSRSSTLFTQTGMDLVAMAKTNVYQTKDAAAAAKIVDGFFAEVQPTSKPANGVRNLDGSRCLQLEDKSFYCLAAADRYAIETSGPTLLDTQQQVAAQYVMLMNS